MIITAQGDGPTLRTFGVNLVQNLLALVFNQDVIPGTCDITAITLHSSDSLGASTYTPTGGNCFSFDPNNLTQVAILLSSADWQAIKNDNSLLVSMNTSYITLGPFIQNSNGIQNEPVETPLAATFFQPEIASLSAIGAILDLDSGQLTLQFNVNVFIVNPTGVTLKDGNFSLTLSGAEGDTPVAPTDNVIINLLPQDQVTLKRQFGSSINFTTWQIDLAAGTAQTEGGISNNDTLLSLNGFIPDVTSPVILTYTLDMNTGTITLTFDEPIDPHTYNLGAVYITNTSSAPFLSNYSLGDGIVTQNSDLLSFVIFIANETVLNLKVDEYIANTNSSSYLYLQPESFTDLSNNLIADTGSAIVPNIFTQDSVPPFLSSFQISLDFATIDLMFSEPILKSSFNPSFISLIGNNQGNTVTLTGQLMTTYSVSQTIVSLEMTTQQVNDLKLVIFNANSSDLYLFMTSNACSDTSNNNVKPIASNDPLIAASVSPDTHHPSLVSYAPNEHPPQNYSMSFTFSEYVDPDSFHISSLTLVLISAVTGSNTFNTFRGGLVTMNDYLTLTYHFSSEDLAGQFPVLFQIAYYSGNMTITFGSEFVTDLRGNIIISPPEPVLFTSNENDPIAPNLQAFSLDLAQGTLQLNFSENVLMLLSSNGLILTSSVGLNNLYTLNSSSYAGLVGMTGISFLINLDQSDINALLTDNTIATGSDNTFLSISQDFAIDFSGNFLNNTTPVQASNVVVPAAESVTISSTQITPSSTNVVSLTETNTPALSSGITIFSSLVEESTSTQTTTSVVTTSSSIMTTSLATSSSTVAMMSSMITSFVMDTSSSVVAVSTSIFISPSPSVSEEASVLTTLSPTSTSLSSSLILTSTTLISSSPSPSPSVPVTITEVYLDMNIGVLTVTLSTNAQLDATIVSNNIAFRNGTHTQTLTGDDGVSFYSPSIRNKLNISITTSDLNSLKSIRVSETWMVTIAGNTFTGSQGNTNIMQTLSFDFVPDTTSPELSSSLLDMDEGVLFLTFTEPVLPNVLDASNIYITNTLVNSPPSAYNLTGSFVNSSASNIITITLFAEKLIEIKADTDTASRLQDSFLFLSQGSLQDYSGNLLLAYGAQVVSYVNDNTFPILLSYELDLNAGSMMMRFDEPVDTSSLDTTGSMLTKDPPPNPVSSSANVVGTFNGSSNQNTILTLTITSNLNEIKLALYSGSSAFITIPSTFINDVANNPIAPIDTANRQEAITIVADTVSPQVIQFSADATSPQDGTITFTFNEYVQLFSLTEASLMITLNNSLSNETYSGFSSGSWSAAQNDSVTYQFSQSDRQQMFFGVLYLLSSNAGDIRVRFGSNLATDLYGNMVVAPNTDYVHTATKQDNIQPFFQLFVIDLDTGNLVLSFSEPVILLAVPGNIQFQNAATNPSITYTLFSNAYNNQTGLFGTSVTVGLEQQDNELLLNNTNLANTISDTFILVMGPLAIDYSGNILNAASAVQATNVITPLTPDNPPILQSTTLDFNTGSLTLTFTTTLNPSLTVPSSIKLTNGLIEHILASSSTVNLANSNGTAVRILFTSSDSIAVKYTILTSNTSWNVSLNANAIISAEGEGNNPQSLLISNVISDVTSPSVTGYSFDMNTGNIVITFDEPMKNTYFNASAIWLSGTVNTQPSGIVLSNSAIVLNSISNTQLTLGIQSSILNTIKADTSVGTEIANTYLFFTSESFQDLSLNNLQPSSQSIQPSSFTSDTTSPILNSFSLDLDSGLLSLSFNEVVNADNFDVSGLRIYNSNLSNSLIITGSSLLSTGLATNIDIMLLSSLNDIKVLIVPQGVLTSRLSMTSSTVNDANTNPVIAISYSNPIVSSQVVPDTTSPLLVSLIAGDQTQRTLKMTFNEFVQPTSWNGGGLTLHLNTSIGLSTFTDFADGSVSSDVSTNLTYTISATKFETLQIKYQQAYYSGSIGVSLASNAVKDLSSNPVMATAAPVYYFSMATDPVTPQLISFELNLDLAKLTMTFSEEVVVNLIPGNVRIQNTASSPSQSKTLSSSSYSSQEGTTGNNITLDLLTQDVIGIAANTELGSSVSNTYLYLNSNFAVDYSGNFLPAQANAIQATSVIDFSGPLNPQVTSFDLDLDSDQMTLHFSSPVNVSTLIPSRITLLNTSTITVSSKLVTLSNVTVIAQGEQSNFRILLSIQDIINVKRQPVCYTSANCYATFDQGLALNSIQLPSVSTSPIQVTTLIEDVTPPRFLSFPIFDLDNGLFTIIFSEPINGSSTDFTQVKFSNALINPSQTVTLTEGFTSPDHVEIDFNLHRNDLNALKYNLNLCTDRTNCWIALPSFFVSDIGSNPFLHSNYQPGAFASYHQPTVFIPDTTSPVLESFSIDMNLGQLVLSFNEVVNEAEFRPSDVTLLNAVSGSLTLVLNNQTSYSRINQGTAIHLELTIADLNWIKARDIYTSVQDSYLSLVTDMTDVSNNVFIDILYGSAMQASIFLEDTTQVQLLSFDAFNIDNGSFFVTFNEPVQASVINLMGVTLTSGTSGSPVTYRLTGGLATPVNEDRLSVMIELARNDRVAIKLLAGLATEESNTYIAMDLTTVKDTANNTNAIVTISSAIRLTNGGYTPDTSLAELSSAELDMNQGQLKLIFNDVINAQSVAPFLVSIQNKSTSIDSSTYTISTSSIASSQSSDEMYIYLHVSDLNKIKANLQLATQASDSYVSFPATMAEDIEGRNVIGVPDTIAQMVAIYVRDTTSPMLTSYNLDMDTGIVIMNYTESVLLSSFTPTELSIQNSASSPSSMYQFKAGTLNPQTQGTLADSVITLNIDYNDLNEIKSRTSLATGSSDTFLNVGSNLFQDTSQNNIANVSAMTPNTYQADTTLPELVAFNLDIRSGGKVILKFSEAVYYTVSLQSTIRLQNKLTNPTVTIQLDSTESVTKTGLDEISISLSSAHTNQLLSDPDIAETADTLYISMTAGGVYDYSGGQNGQGQSIASFTNKVTNLCKLKDCIDKMFNTFSPIDRTCFDGNTYNNATLGTCESCSSVCVGGCSGSRNTAGEGGCSLCDIIILDANRNQVKFYRQTIDYWLKIYVFSSYRLIVCHQAHNVQLNTTVIQRRNFLD